MECFNRFSTTNSVAPEDEKSGLPFSRGEKWVAAFLLLSVVAFKVFYLLQRRFDSDEPQHLHVVWGWANGLVQYRDLFDNHSPLFHLLFTPVFAALGERANILFLMRIAMLPFFVASLLCVYVIGRALFNPPLGSWAAIFAALAPPFHLTSTEFRPDNLWTFFWLAALAVYFSRPAGLKSCFWVGLLLGAALSVSMKTTLLIGVYLGALLGAAVCGWQNKQNLAWRNIASCFLVGAAGFIIFPGLLIIGFMSCGAGDAFYDCVVRHNILPGLNRWKTIVPRALIFPWLASLAWFAARWLYRRSPGPSVAFQRVTLFLTALLYITALQCFWPLVTRQDDLPFYPLAAIFWALIIPHGSEWIGRRFENRAAGFPPWGGPLAAGLIEICWLTHVDKPWSGHSQPHYHLLQEVLWLTKPGDYLMDLKGETVFRPRPYYYALERITRTRIIMGLLPDAIPERLRETRTCVVVSDNNHFPTRAREFMNTNYIGSGYLRVAGMFLNSASPDNPQISFEIAIAADYAVVTPKGLSKGLLDGQLCKSRQFLAPGEHSFLPAEGEAQTAVVWADAVEKNFDAFSKGRPYRTPETPFSHGAGAIIGGKRDSNGEKTYLRFINFLRAIGSRPPPSFAYA